MLQEGGVYWDGWTGLLLQVGDVWAERESERRPAGGPAEVEASDLATRWLLANADRMNGGFGAFPKYVLPAVHEYAALRWARGQGELGEHTRHTLEVLVASPLFDPVEGGVHRLAGAPSFGAIQYEKMLEGNAALVRELTYALREKDSPELREALEATSRFIVDVLGRPEGGFWLAQSADIRSTDGGGYWQAEQGQRAAPPPVDRTVLAGPSVLAGAALMRAALSLGDDELFGAGRAALDFVHDTAYHPGRGMIHAIEPSGDTAIYLVAQADAALGFADAYETTGDPRFLEAARRIVQFVRANLSDPRLAAMRDSLPDPLAVGLMRNARWPQRPNVRLARAMIRLSWHGLDEPLRQRAMQILSAYCGNITNYGVHGTELALAIEEGNSEPLRVLVSGPAEAPETRALRRAAVNSPWPWTLVSTDDRSRHPAITRPGVARPHDDRDRSPAVDDPRRRHDLCPRERPSRRAGPPPGSRRCRRHLRGSLGGSNRASRTTEATLMDHAAIVRTAVAERGRVEGPLLRVDDWLNHRIDIPVLDHAGAHLASLFAGTASDVILTAEASGIAPALATGRVLGLPVLFAKKFLGPGDRHAHAREVASPTKGTEYRVEVSRRMLEPGLNVLVIDDFLSGGRTAEALGDITEEADCSITGLGFVIEKTWLPGRDRLEDRGWLVESVVRVTSLDDGIVLEG